MGCAAATRRPIADAADALQRQFLCEKPPEGDSRAREGVPPEAVAVRERVFSCIIAGEAARLPMRRRVEFGMVDFLR